MSVAAAVATLSRQALVLNSVDSARHRCTCCGAGSSWCSRSRIQLLGTGDKWRRGSSLQISEFGVPLTGQHLHLRLAELQTYPGTRCARVSIEQLHVHIQMCSDRRYTRVADAGSKRKMVCWVEAMPRPRPLLPPLEGGGRQPCTGLRVVLPPVRKSPVNRTICTCCRGAHMCRKDCGHGGGAGRAQMHGADAPACAADVRRVRDRPTERRARCLRAPASLLCVGFRCDVQCGAMRVDALGAVPPVQ